MSDHTISDNKETLQIFSLNDKGAFYPVYDLTVLDNGKTISFTSRNDAVLFLTQNASRFLTAKDFKILDKQIRLLKEEYDNNLPKVLDNAIDNYELMPRTDAERELDSLTQQNKEINAQTPITQDERITIEKKMANQLQKNIAKNPGMVLSESQQFTLDQSRKFRDEVNAVAAPNYKVGILSRIFTVIKRAIFGDDKKHVAFVEQPIIKNSLGNITLSLANGDKEAAKNAIVNRELTQFDDVKKVEQQKTETVQEATSSNVKEAEQAEQAEYESLSRRLSSLL